jgi:hypothetical protein
MTARVLSKYIRVYDKLSAQNLGMTRLTAGEILCQLHVIPLAISQSKMVATAPVKLCDHVTKCGTEANERLWCVES